MSGSGRKVLIGFGVIVGLVLVVLILVPVLFEGRIAARAKTEIEKRIDAHVDWRDAGLTFFRSFPNLTLDFEALTVTGAGRFEGDTLASIPAFGLVLDVGSVLFGDQAVVRSIVVDEPAVHLVVLEDGTKNWDIVRPRPATGPAAASEGGGLNVGLRRLSIGGARIVLDNRQNGLSISLAGVDHTLRGDFTRDRFTIRTRTQADTVTVRSAAMRYLDDVELDMTADIDADMATRTFTFGDNQLRLNQLLLEFTGSVAKEGDDLALDLELASPGNRFVSVLSLVPAIWARDFESLRTDGQLSVAGRITGHYGENAFPAVALNAKVDNASFQYPDQPLAARQIYLDLAVNNPGGDADSTVIDVQRFHALIGDEPIAATLTVHTPVSDPELNVTVNGTLDLDAARRTFELEDIEELAGKVNADFSVHARKSALEAQDYERVAASGEVVASNVRYRSSTFPHPVSVDALDLGISPATAELRRFDGTVGSSDMHMSGTLRNLIGFLMGAGELRGDASFESNRFDLDEWRSEDSNLAVILVPPRVDFALRTSIAQLHHGNLDMTDARGSIRLADERLTIDSLRLNAVGGEFQLTGYYETTDPERPTFDVDVAIDNADVAQSFEALTTVRLLAPVAHYAQGRFSTSLQLGGPLSQDMTPVITAITGRGALRTTQILLRDFPPLQQLAGALNSSRLSNPGFRAISTSIEIRDGRLYVKPFDASIGETTLTVAGSNGIDRSLDYDLVLELPQSGLEGSVRQKIGDLFRRAGGAGIDLDSVSLVQVAVKLGGTVDDPSISLDVGRGVETALQSIEEAARSTVEDAAGEITERVDSATAAAVRRAELEGQRLIAEAEQRAGVIRAEADSLAATIRRQAALQADSLVARAGSPVARIAAEQAARTLRGEADDRATQVTTEADRRADALVAEARAQADALIRAAGGQPDTSRIRSDTLSADTGAAPLQLRSTFHNTTEAATMPTSAAIRPKLILPPAEPRRVQSRITPQSSHSTYSGGTIEGRR